MDFLTSVPESDDEEQKRIARLYVWHSLGRMTALQIPFLLIFISFMARASHFSTPFLIGLASLNIVSLVAGSMNMARRQLALFRQSEMTLTRDLISARPRRAFMSPLDPISSFDLCADVLSSIGTAKALDYRTTMAFGYDQSKGLIQIGRWRPFWVLGSVVVEIAEMEGRRTQVIVRRKPGLNMLQVQTGSALQTVEAVTSLLRDACQQRRRALDADKRERTLERAALQAKLVALQAQVEPHFLYNTLANLKYLIRTDPDIAQQMVEHLVGYLQTAMPDMRSVSSTVGREVELVRHFLSIMQIRMGKRLSFEFDVDDDALDLAVPPAMLISLVENAVKHGLERATRPGRITIGAAIEGAQLVLRVADDGIGLKDEAGQGFGLANIHERLKLLYGEAASLLVAPGALHGVTVTLTIPLSKQQER